MDSFVGSSSLQAHSTTEPNKKRDVQDSRGESAGSGSGAEPSSAGTGSCVEPIGSGAELMDECNAALFPASSGRLLEHRTASNREVCGLGSVFCDPEPSRCQPNDNTTEPNEHTNDNSPSCGSCGSCGHCLVAQADLVIAS